MPVNGFTVGRDVSLTVNVKEGVKNFSLITNFNSKPTATDAKVKGLDGITRHVIFHDGWSGSFDIERQDSTLDDYWAKLEADFHAGVSLQAGTITETIVEPGGGYTQWRYDGVVLKLTDAGDKAGDKTVKQKLEFLASRRIKVV